MKEWHRRENSGHVRFWKKNRTVGGGSRFLIVSKISPPSLQSPRLSHTFSSGAATRP